MDELKHLYQIHTGALPDEIKQLPQSASARKYFRLKSGAKSIIGTFSPDIKETGAFVAFSKHFHTLGIHVPEVYLVSEDQRFYLQEDIGDVVLHNLMKESGFNFSKAPGLLAYYRKALEELVRMQYKGHIGLDYSLSVPRAEFDQQSILWDLNHFKYYFLKLSGLTFNEDLLERDFQDLIGFLTEKPMSCFMFRDFQSRNIMIHLDQVFFIDYQGGRKGPPQYDLASLLFEAKTQIPEEIREELLNEYIKYASEFDEINPEAFNREFYWWSLIRVLQVLGAYGLRGLIEKKPVFLQSIPLGLGNLGYILGKIEGGPALPELKRCLSELVESADNYPGEPKLSKALTISVTSFSYRKNYPDDLSGHGGGFVYDCRFIANPGRFEKYRSLTGFDAEVEAFFREKGDMDDFLKDVKAQLDKVAQSYLDHGYTHLSVSFGCTGGQHRSVYSARMISEYLRQRSNVSVIEKHRELPEKGAR